MLFATSFLTNFLVFTYEFRHHGAKENSYNEGRPKTMDRVMGKKIINSPMVPAKPSGRKAAMVVAVEMMIGGVDFSNSLAVYRRHPLFFHEAIGIFDHHYPIVKHSQPHDEPE